MDLSTIVAQQKAAQDAKYKSVTVDKDIPLETDPGLLTVVDPNPVDSEAYSGNLETHLLNLARDGVQVLLAQIFSLPTQKSIHGPLAVLPTSTTRLPRAKPLPKAKEMSRWQKFANAKGIQHRKKLNKVWDEERQEWRARWGRGGKNRDAEEQWLHEIPASKPDNWDPAAEARKARKERKAKNDLAHAKNEAHSARIPGSRSERKAEIDKTLLRARTSTASMGKFDKVLDGEKKIRGVKRKFSSNETPAAAERDSALALISKLDGRSTPAKKPRRLDQTRAEDVINVRKAIKSASKGYGSAALAKASEKEKFRSLSKSARKKMRGVRK